MYGYLNQASTLSALGVPVNFSAFSVPANKNFETTADIERADSLDYISYLLDSGIKVHLMFGDRDFSGNWLGGEAVSLAVNYSRAAECKLAGYARILGSEGVDGFVRQLGNFSFSRVFQAGHEGMSLT